MTDRLSKLEVDMTSETERVNKVLAKHATTHDVAQVQLRVRLQGSALSLLSLEVMVA
jgi:hypothetical protein